jgi:NTP pyrophosphatase (non-canonical NTP hydrolase)
MAIMTAAMQEALYRISQERSRQNKLKAEGRFAHTAADPECLNVTRLAMLTEEVGEVARALNHGTHDPEQDLTAELVQVAAICMAWIEYQIEHE